MKGYKVFNPDWTCKGKKYSCPGEFVQEGKLELCENGIHFCKNLIDCFSYYDFSPNNRVAEIEAIGSVIDDEDDKKSCTDRIKIVREIDWYEVLTLVNIGNGNSGNKNIGDRNSGNGNSGDRNSGYGNSGNGNSGYGNSGNGNSGNGNSGDWNSGNWNSGDRNSGDGNIGDRNSGNGNSGDRNSGYGNSGNGNSGYWNSGDGNSGYGNSGNGNSGNWNSGDRNSGNRNIGDRNSGNGNSGNGNSGDWNSGNGNSGYWNSGDGNSGVFCVEKNPTIRMFDKESEWTIDDWINSEPARIMGKYKTTTWVVYDDMTIEEKEDYPESKTTGGYLRKNNIQEWWDKLPETDKKSVMRLPNFDADIFMECTGIDVKKNE